MIISIALECSGEAPDKTLNLDWITQFRPGSVRLDIRDRCGIHCRVSKGARDDLSLSRCIRRGWGIGPAAMVDRASAEHGVDMVSISQRRMKGLQHQDANPLATHVPVRR
jgi:hypothetical protein